MATLDDVRTALSELEHVSDVAEDLALGEVVVALIPCRRQLLRRLARMDAERLQLWLSGPQGEAVQLGPDPHAQNVHGSPNRKEQAEAVDVGDASKPRQRKPKGPRETANPHAGRIAGVC